MRVLPNPAAHFKAVQIRQHQIEQHDVRAVALEQVEPGQTISGERELVAAAVEVQFEQLAVATLVVDNQHTGGTRDHDSTSWPQVSRRPR